MVKNHTSRIVVARLNFAPWIKKEEFGPIDRIVKLMIEGEEVSDPSGKFDWVFGDVSRVMVEQGEEIFAARLGKVHHGKKEPFYDKKKHGFFKSNYGEGKGSYSNLAIFPKVNIIMFEEKPPTISVKSFIGAFERNYRNLYDDLSWVRIEPFSDAEKIMFELRKSEKVYQVKMDLVPSNPEDEDDFRSLDESLKEGNVATAKYDFSNKNGLNPEAPIIKQGVALGAHGYGHIEAKVLKDGIDQIIRSKDRIREFCIEVTDDPVEVAKECYIKLKGIIHERG